MLTKFCNYWILILLFLLIECNYLFHQVVGKSNLPSLFQLQTYLRLFKSSTTHRIPFNTNPVRVKVIDSAECRRFINYHRYTWSWYREHPSPHIHIYANPVRIVCRPLIKSSSGVSDRKSRRAPGGSTLGRCKSHRGYHLVLREPPASSDQGRTFHQFTSGWTRDLKYWSACGGFCFVIKQVHDRYGCFDVSRILVFRFFCTSV